jgi:hypothetical protein
MQSLKLTLLLGLLVVLPVLLVACGKGGGGY